MNPKSKHPATHAKKLFEEPAPPAEVWRANVDGASRGNPGPASYAALVRKPDGTLAARISRYIGRTTNNVAEYYGLIAALDYAAAHGVARLRVESDSELLVRQMQGRYKVKSADLKPLHEKARKLAASLAFVEFVHVPREKNADADALANEALDGTGAASRQTPAASSTARPPHATPQTSSKTIRAHYWDGVIVPEEPLDLADGDKVVVTIEKLK
jgi:ribonuclease HI